VLPGLLQSALESELWAKAARANNADYYPLYAGQSAGMIRDLPGAAEVVAALVREADAVVRSLLPTDRNQAG
jgi:hypothetical protein